MIRRSTAIGVVALFLSLLVHLMGLALALPSVTTQQISGADIEQVALSETFEELADVQVQPVEPERAETPEPPVETPREPEPAEAPTSEVLVASDNPQETSAPDRGAVRTPSPRPSGTVTPETGDVSEPVTDTRSGGTETSVSDARITPPVGVNAGTTALGVPEAPAASVPEVSTPVAPSAATTPSTADPVAPVADAPAPDVVAALPPEITASEDSSPPVAAEDTERDDDRPSDSIANSLRPQSRPEGLSPRPTGTVDGTANQTEGQPSPTELIESPLTAYRRDGTNLFAGQRGGAQSGGAGSGGALGPGNADVTNYAGEVLMHLNRVPPVAVSTRGWARVVFRIEPNGSLGFVDIIDGSGASEIEIAAKSHVRKGVPFPRPPGGESRVLSFFYRIQ